jgi:uncharacterized protein (DUF736 family)
LVWKVRTMVEIKKEKNPNYLGVAWINTSKTGDEYLTVKLNKDIVDMPNSFKMFKNGYKKKDTDPDWSLVRELKKEE